MDTTIKNSINNLLVKFSIEEIQIALDSFALSTAAGPDKWLDVAALRKIGATRLTLILNFFLLHNKIPRKATVLYCSNS